MKLPIGIAQKLLQLLQGQHLPASALQHSAVTKMLEDGVIQKQQTGKTKALLFIRDTASTHTYIRNHFGINNLHEYVNLYHSENLTRGDAALIAGTSKLKPIRTFKGFLVNAYEPVAVILCSQPFIIHPTEGAFTFISNCEKFSIPPHITIVGVENPENFTYISRQRYLFSHLQPLFVSRYPQSNDLVQWLRSISNAYLHFGDIDFAGINIYLNEYKPHLGERASFFIPPNVEVLIQQYGNRDLYNMQLPYWNNRVTEPGLKELVNLLHQYKKGLEQEVLIKGD